MDNTGTIRAGDAPTARRGTKAADAEKKKENLLQARRAENLNDQPDTTVEDLESSKEKKMSRNYQDHYANVVEICTAHRIWASRTITPREAHRAQECHGRACRSWAHMNCHLTPVFHLSEHNEAVILRHGPVYSWWGFPFEQHNGFLKKFRHNGHRHGELEATMIRGHIKYALISDLVSILVPSANDIDALLTCVDRQFGTHSAASSCLRRRSSPCKIE